MNTTQHRPAPRMARLATWFASALMLAGCNGGEAPAPEAKPPGGPRHDTAIVASRELGTMETRLPGGQRVGVHCANCHGLKQPAGSPRPESAHRALLVAHGANTCDACHTREDRSTLHLADGTRIPFSETMRLCAQCHGPQSRDYARGSHGGMSGYWDLTRGPRTRNHCVNCHDPHQPAYPQVQPAPPPRDRFLTPAHGDGHHAGGKLSKLPRAPKRSTGAPPPAKASPRNTTGGHH